MSFTSINILINNTVPPKLMGRVNGFAQMLNNLAKGVGPTIGGLAFAWSSSNGLPFPLDQSMYQFVIF